VLAERLSEAGGDVGGGELAGRHLVQQRLELVVVVLVDERHADVGALGQLSGAAQPGDRTLRRRRGSDILPFG
jgi:hypothetical protein